MKYLMLGLCLIFWSCSTNGQTAKKSKKVDTSPISVEIPEIENITKTDADWKTQLSEQEYYVLREAGTERAHTGDLWDKKDKGLYTCAACQLPLFDSATKYKSGTGWPSFYQPIDPVVVEEDVDQVLGYARREIHCARCKGHLGHVFEDGPKPTGLRYCMNSVSMDFVPVEKLNKE